MAANTMTLEHDDRGGLFGRSFVRLTIAALMAVFVLGAIANAASAKPATTTMGQNDFTSKCRAGGGTPKRLAPHVVQCTTGLGEVVICDFNSSPARCIVPKTHGPEGVLDSVITDGVMVEAEPAPSGPGIRPGQVLSTGAVLVEAEPAPATSDPTLATTGDLQVIEPVATEDPGTSEALADQVSPVTEQVLVAEPAVVEFVEDEES